jgi:penicillin amidase
VQYKQRATVRGPIVNHILASLDESDSAPISLRWVGREHLDDVRALVALGRAQSWNEFRAALRDWAVAVFNFGYADASGHAGFQCAGRVPVRGRAACGYRQANAAEDLWQGYLSFDALPRAIDPSRGYVASANERVAPDDYPYALHGSWGAGHRATRMHQELGNNSAVDLAFVMSLQNDVKSCQAERLCPPLVEHLAASDDADVALLRETLSTWDYCYTLDSVAPALFETFLEAWQERVIRERFPARLLGLLHGQTGAAARLIERGDLDWFEAGGVRDEVIATASRAMCEVRKRFGNDPSAWRWGVVHRARWHHPLSGLGHPEFDISPESVDGCDNTLRNTGAGQPGYSADGGVEYRLIVDFANPDRFHAVQNIGNSGQPGHPHYADQFSDWLAGRYHVVCLNRADVERDLESSRTLEWAAAGVAAAAAGAKGED